MVSSGAMSPARAPASIDMLHTVMRPSIDNDRIASPVYSMTWPVPPAVPMRPIMLRMTSLAVTPVGNVAVDGDAHVFRTLLEQRLRGQHMLDLAGADAESQRAERAVGRGMAVAADDGGARQSETLLRPNDVHDALADIVDLEIGHAECGAILDQGFDLNARGLVRDAGGAVGGDGRNIVVGDRKRGVGPAHLAASLTQALKGLRAGDFVHQMAVDIDQRRAVILGIDQVAVPNLVE